MCPLIGAQAKAFGNVVLFPGNRSKDFFITADGVLENPDAPKAALVNVGIHSSGHNKFDDGNCSARLYLAVDPPDHLINPHGVPRKIVIDKETAELEIESFTADLR